MFVASAGERISKSDTERRRLKEFHGLKGRGGSMYLGGRKEGIRKEKTKNDRWRGRDGEKQVKGKEKVKKTPWVDEI